MRLGAPEMPLPFASPTDPAVGRRHRLARRGQRRRGYPRERAVILSSGPRLTVPLAHLARRSTPASPLIRAQPSGGVRVDKPPKQEP